KIGADAEELEPKALRLDGENALQLVQWINLEETEGQGAAQGPGTARTLGVRGRPSGGLGATLLARTTGDEAPDLGPAGGGLGNARLPLAASRFCIGADPERGDQPVGVDLRRLVALNRDVWRLRLCKRRHEPADMRMRPSSANGHHQTLRVLAAIA